MPSNYITVDAINHINAELSNYCNAACPMCARFDHEQKLIPEITNNTHTTLQDMTDKIGTRVIKNLKTFRSCGNVGDGTMNPECLQIYEFIKKTNNTTNLLLNTNGGARNTDFFRDMANLGVKITFSIDGLEDTNHLYRRNVKWGKLMSNVESFIKAGGVAGWDYLIFKHNEHQVTDAETLSKQLGFAEFNKKTTTRWDDFDSDGNWMQREKIDIDGYALEKPLQDESKAMANDRDLKVKEVEHDFNIVCNSFVNKNVEIFLHANGNVSPCCWLGDLALHESKNIISDFDTVNIHHRSLDEILDSDFFVEIYKGIQGSPQQYKLQTCQQVCGRCQ
jgi:MoaA/NifB/PqqE/SkfB family radical SAM enzyme